MLEQRIRATEPISTTLDLLVKVEQTLKEMNELLLLAQIALLQGIRMEALRVRLQSVNEERNNDAK